MNDKASLNYLEEYIKRKFTIEYSILVENISNDNNELIMFNKTMSQSNIYNVSVNEHINKIRMEEYQLSSGYIHSFYSNKKLLNQFLNKIFEKFKNTYEDKSYLNIYSYEDENKSKYIIELEELFKLKTTKNNKYNEKQLLISSKKIIKDIIDNYLYDSIYSSLLGDVEYKKIKEEKLKIKKVKIDKEENIVFQLIDELGNKKERKYYLINNKLYNVETKMFKEIKLFINKFDKKQSIKKIFENIKTQKLNKREINNIISSIHNNNLDLAGLISNIFVDSIKDFKEEDDWVSSAPNSSTFRALKSGETKTMYNDWLPPKDYYDFSRFVPFGIKIGTNTKHQDVLKDIFTFIIKEINKIKRKDKLIESKKDGSAYETIFVYREDNNIKNGSASAYDCYGYNNVDYINKLDIIKDGFSNIISNIKEENIENKIEKSFKLLNEKINTQKKKKIPT